MWCDECWPYLVICGTLYFTGIGIPPLPEEVPIAAAGIAATRQEINWCAACLVGVVGILLADVTLYCVGRGLGKSLVGVGWVRRLVSPERQAMLQARFRNNALKFLLSGRLLPGFRTGVFLTAGTMRDPFGRFLLVDGFAAILSVSLVFFGSCLLTEPLLAVLGA